MAAAAMMRALRSSRATVRAALRPVAASSSSLQPRYLSSEPSLSLERCVASSDILVRNHEIRSSSFSSAVRALMLAGVAGIGMFDVASADAKEDFPGETAISSNANSDDIYKVVSEERKRIEEALQRNEMSPGSYPPYKVSSRGEEVVVKFRIPSSCRTLTLIADIAARLGLKEEESCTGSNMVLRSLSSDTAWRLIFSHPEQQSVDQVQRDEQKNNNEGALSVLMFESLLISEDTEIEFIKKGRFNSEELEAVASALKIASVKGKSRTSSKGTVKTPKIEKTVASLEAMGVRVFGLDESCSDVPTSEGGISWGNVAGYEQQKGEIEDTIVLALRSPEVFNTVARGTRTVYEPNRPRAILFEGPPGTGKTTCARVIANHSRIPLLYVPLEVLMSKYYGESERLLGDVFSLAKKLPDGALIFLDEIDSLATDRADEIHEATRRLLSVLLRQIDGFEQDQKLVIIAATNRLEDLDPALVSRFDSMITFGLPDQKTREEIASQYAKHLTKYELWKLARAMPEMSGRDIRGICIQAERRWAAKIIRGAKNLKSEDLPPLEEYLACAELRKNATTSIKRSKNRKDLSKVL